MQTRMKTRLVSGVFGAVLLAAVSLPAAADLHAHDGHAPDTGQWYHAEVTVTTDDTWGIEHCFESVPDRRIRYQIEASEVLDMNFHVHPERGGEYYAEYFMRENGLAAYTGEARTDEPGVYCFAFYLPTGDTVPRGVEVRYRVDH